jgi:DNA-binding IclR family transcriptional regulator
VPEQTVVLSVLNDTEVVYIGRRPGSRAVGANYELGMRLPANCTASGKALLSTLEPDRVRDLLSEFEPDGLPILTKRSINALSALVQELIARAEHDYALDDEETAVGMICVGAPIRGATGKAVAAVAVSTRQGCRQR